MPTYSYACTECGNRFDAVQSFTDAALTTCSECNGRLRKLFGNVGVVFKGSGFYRTDSREAAKSAATSSSNGSDSTSESTSSSSASSSDKSSSDKSSSDKSSSDKSSATSSNGSSSGSTSSAPAAAASS